LLSLGAQTVPPLPTVTGPLAGTIGGDFEVTSSGAAQYKIPLTSPPGTASLIPKLALTYNSQASDGLLGIGWSLEGLSAITRCPTNLVQDNSLDPVDFDSADRFCLDGTKLLNVSGGEYFTSGNEYKTESEGFAQIVSAGLVGGGPESFTVRYKNSLIYEYGTSPSSRVEAEGKSSVLNWNLSTIKDRSGNYLTVTYSENNATGETVPFRIDYTGNTTAGLAPYNSIRFEYIDRATQTQAFIGGSRVIRSKTLSKIAMYNGESVVREFRLSYDQDYITQSPRLIRVEECADSACLPATTFNWGAMNVDYQPFPTLWNLSPAHGYTNANVFPIFSGDWNGDGRMDIARVHPNGILFYTSEQDGFVFYTDPAGYGTNQGFLDAERYPVLVGDWNGDGRTDFGRVGNYGIHFHVATDQEHTATSFIPYTDINSMGAMQGWTNATQYPVITGDWNGDGRTDFARVHGQGLAFFVSTGTGFQWYADPGNFSPGQGYTDVNTYPILVGDWNGDGMSDVARVHGTGVMFLVSVPGGGFQWRSNIADLSPQQGYTNGTTYPIFTGDWNGDGLTDIARVHGGGIIYYVSTGGDFGWYNNWANYSPAQGYTETNTYPLLTGDWNGDGSTDVGRVTGTNFNMFQIVNGQPLWHTYIPHFSPAQGLNDVSVYPFIVGDWNGDGFTDIGRVTSGGIAIYSHNPTATSAIESIQDGVGKQTSITYKYLTDSSVYTKGGGAQFPKVDVKSSLRVVQSARSSNGMGGMAQTRYKYANLRYYLNGRGSAGFERIDVTDDQTGVTTTTSYHQEYPWLGLPYLREKRLSNGTLIARDSSTWNTAWNVFGGHFDYISRSVEEGYELSGSLIDTKTTDSTYDAYGNPTQITATHSDGNVEATTTTYTNNTSAWLLGQITQSQVQKTRAGQPALTRASQFTYNAAGLVQTEVTEPATPALAVTRTYSYDAYGNITSTTVAGTGFTSITETRTYDTRGQFPAAITNALNQQTTFTYDPRHGTMTQSTDPNNLTTQWVTDSFGRAYREIRSDGTESRTLYLAPDANAPSETAYMIRVDASGAPYIITYYDELNREIRKETQGFAGERLFVDKAYNDRGLQTHVSDPYFNGSSPLWTVSEFDALGRLTLTTAPGGRSSSTSYNGFVATTTDPLTHTTVRTTDSLGRVLSIRDARNNVTTYSYDSYGNVTLVTDSLGNTTVATYNNRGSRLTHLDPDAGLTTYTYNGLGQIVTQADAKNQVTTFTYDKLGRMTSRVSPEGTEQWVFDTATYGVGKLKSTTGVGGFSQVNSYDSQGRISQVQKTIAGTNFTISSNYNVFGQLKTLTYPSGFAVEHVYTPLGYLQEIRQTSDNKVLWQGTSKNARGQFLQETLGNGLINQSTYDATTGFLTRIKAGTIHDFSFTFDAIGNLSRRHDNVRSLTEDFVYDELHRLTSTQVAGQAAKTIAYDAIGNITSRSDVGTYTYGANGAGPHAVTSIAGTQANTFTYDQVGNRIQSNGGNVVYTAFGVPKTITSGLTQETFTFDTNYGRIQQIIRRKPTASSPTYSILDETKTYVDDLYEKVVRGTTTKQIHYVRTADGPVAISTTTNTSAPVLTYLHKDHLGSVQTITNDSGVVTDQFSFDAWGRKRAPDWTDTNTTMMSNYDRTYTGHEYLEEVALIHMNGRVYDPIVGRFLSPDAMAQAPLNPQNLNRYSYVLNNPLSYTDPSGLFFSKVFKNLFKTAVIVAVAYFTNGAVMGLFSGGPLAGSVLAMGVSGAASGLSASIAGSIVNGRGLSTGFKSGIRAAPLNALKAMATWGVGEGFDNGIGESTCGEPGALAKAFGGYATEAKVIAHGLVSGGFAEASGSSFGSGFLNGVAGELGARGGKIEAALLGGTAAAIGGGRFAEGAMQGAFIHMFNHDPHDRMNEQEELANSMMLFTRLSDAFFHEAEEWFHVSHFFHTIEASVVEPAVVFKEFSHLEHISTAKPKINMLPWRVRLHFYLLRTAQIQAIMPGNVSGAIGLLNYGAAEGFAAIADYKEQQLLESLKQDGIEPYKD